MSNIGPKPVVLPTNKLAPTATIVNANHHSATATGSVSVSIPSNNAIASLDPTTPSNVVDAGRKKSGFVITRVDKASNPGTILENESDFENECNDHGIFVGGGGSSPGSSSIMSETSTVDGGSLEKPLNISRAPPPTPAGATPTSPAWPSSTSQQHRPSGLTAFVSANSAVAGAAALLAAANTAAQASTQQAQQQTVVIPSPSTQSVPPPSTITRETSMSSRFHIIKIETGPYKRGRWNCRDFDESTGSFSGAVRSDMIAVGPRSGSSSNSSGRPSYHIVAEENGHGAGDHTLLILASASEHHSPAGHLSSKPPLPSGHHHHHHHQHHPQQHSPLPTASAHSSQQSKSIAPTTDASAFAPVSRGAKASAASSSNFNVTSLSNFAQQQSNQRSQSPASTTIPPTPTPISRFQVRPSTTVDLNNAAAAILDSIVGSMQQDNNRIVIGAGGGRQQTSVITSSSTAGSTASGGATAVASVVVDGPIGGGGNIGMGQGSAAVTLAHGSAGSNVVAIDNKIEQAMDLVKTHLLYAVREEVEVLKEKIIDLERKVFRLETENKLLREYAPPEILQQIQHQQHQHHHQPPPQLQSQASSGSNFSTTSGQSTPVPMSMSNLQSQSQHSSSQQSQPPTSQTTTQNAATPVSTTVSAALSSAMGQQQQQQQSQH